MGLLDRLLGRENRADDNRAGRAWPDQSRAEQGRAGNRSQQPPGGAARGDDEVAIERYRYLLRTAPPEQVEQAHAEAFAKLTPEQRREVLAELSDQVPPGERAQSDDPRSLARMATRAEMRQPGTMERTLGRGGGMGGGIGMGGMIAGGLLASVAGAFVGTAIADAMFDSNDSGEGGDASAEGGDAQGGDAQGGDAQGGDAQGGDAQGAADGGDYGSGGDYGGGGGDYGGGGDFGGGDMGGF